MMTNEYSFIKAAWHIEKIARLRDGLQIVPSHVQLIISDLCNQNCSFCAYRKDGGFSTEQFGEMVDGKLVKNPNRRIPYDKACEILSDCRDMGVKAIQFTGGGEPTVHPNHIDIFKHAQFLGLQTGLVTNGLVMRDPQTIADMNWVRFSLDAGTTETYEAIRESKGFSKVLHNIYKVVECRTPCHIGIGFVVTKDNWIEINDACRIAQELGVKYIRLSAMFSEEGSSHYVGIQQVIEESIKSAKDLETNTFKIIDLFSRRIDDLDTGVPKHPFCGYQNFTTYIGGDCKVYRCCTTSYTKHGEVGDLSNMSFAKWLTSWERREEYTDFDARSCHHCQFHAANETINYMLETPDHVEFV
jgi:MoaA/NifB/PqqE/SkfB family radical SAM enzyme